MSRAAQAREAHMTAVTKHQTAARSGTFAEPEVAEGCAVRKPVGVAQVQLAADRDSVAAILCDDGSVWTWGWHSWEEMAPIPGTTRWFVQNPFNGGAE